MKQGITTPLAVLINIHQPLLQCINVSSTSEKKVVPIFLFKENNS
jgi:hypothetical protein